MELNVVIAETLRQATVEAIKNVKISNDLDLNNFIVVPDRFSLLAEKLIFKELGIKSTFNINVISISKLANTVLKLANLDVKPDSEIIGVLKILNILINNKSDLTTFANANITFELAKDIYLTIVQLKSCKIMPEHLAEDLLNEKIKDLHKIYEIYENSLKESFDANDLLNIFSNEIKNSELIKNSNFYFLEFDALTVQGYEILKKLVESAKSVTVGVAFSSSSNDYIYEKDLLFKLKNVSEELHININTIIAKNSLNTLQTKLANGLFALNADKIEVERNQINLIGVSNEIEEVERIAEIINFEVKNNNKHFRDFNVILPNIKNFENVLQKYFIYENITFYLDKDYCLSDLIYVQFINNIFKFSQDIENQVAFFELGNSHIANLSDKEIGLLYSSVMHGKSIDEILHTNFEEENLNNFLNNLLNSIKMLKNIKKLSDFNDFFDYLFDIFSFENSNINLIEKFKKDSDFSNLKLYEQFNSKFEIAKGYLADFSLEMNLDFKELIKIVDDIFESVKISSLPISTDCVFVGQSDVSFFESRDIQICANCNEGEFPKNIKDSGLIADSEIDSFKNIKIEPTVKMLNRRNKFKVFNDLCLTKNKIYLILISNSKESESEVVSSIVNNFVKNGEKISISDDFYNNFILINENFNFKLASKFNIDKFCYKKPESKIEVKNVNDSLFNNKTTSITKIQDYFKCPFYNFVKNGLKIKELENANINERDYGDFFHKFCEIYLKNKKNNIKIDFFAIFNEIIENNSRLKLLYGLKKNNYIFKRLLNEMQELSKEIERHLEATSFKPFRFEEKFNFNLCKDINLVGVIDRIDYDGELFRVLDYKTGESELNLNKVYNGLQLQLPIYMYACNKKFGKCVSGMYFPINYESIKKQNIKLDGFFINDTKIVKKIDKNLSKANLKSKIIKFNLSSKSENDNFIFNSKNKIFSEEELNKCIEYAINLAIKSVSESSNGEVRAIPINENYCKNCYLYKNCSFCLDEANEVRQEAKLTTSSTFLEILRDNNGIC